MSNKSRLQFTSALVRSDRLWGINYAAGNSIAYGATRPGEKFTTTKVLDLKVARLRTRYIGVRFRAETETDIKIRLKMQTVEVHAWDFAASDLHDYLHIHDTGGDPGISDYQITFDIYAMSGAASFVKDVQFFGLWDKSFPGRFAGDIYSESG